MMSPIIPLPPIIPIFAKSDEIWGYIQNDEIAIRLGIKSIIFIDSNGKTLFYNIPEFTNSQSIPFKIPMSCEKFHETKIVVEFEDENENKTYILKYNEGELEWFWSYLSA